MSVYNKFMKELMKTGHGNNMRYFLSFAFMLVILQFCITQGHSRPSDTSDTDDTFESYQQPQSNQNEDNEDESYVNQSVESLQVAEDHDDFDAIVLKPSSAHSLNALRNHFFSTKEKNEESDTKSNFEWEQEKETPGKLKAPFTSHRNDDDEENPQEEESTSTNDNPLDPEEIERRRYSKMVQEQGFSKILSINEALGVRGVYEGDMRFTRLYNAAGDSDLWPKSRLSSNKGIVPIPYKISNAYNKTEVAIIKSAMELYTRHTCIRFVPRKTEFAYIYITDGKGCWAYVGRTGYSAQTVSLGIPGCVAKGIAAHELMHVVGFQHEHSRSDRDKYVTILEHNIQKDMKPNFEIYNNTKNLVIYDYNSVMHYSKNAFSKFQYLPAIQITPKRKPEPVIGQRERMSPYDIEEIKYLYNCADGTYQRCGKDYINVDKGGFTSPKYPSNYPAESHCTWKITVRRGAYISVTFTDIDIEDSPLCQKDAILIHDGINAAASRLKTICGTGGDPVTVVSTGNTMFIMFTSDPAKSSFSGFKASFKKTFVPGAKPTPLTVPKLPTIKKPANDFLCNFEFGTCSMTQDKLDEIDWIRYKGKTPSHGTGPSADHTTGTGYYMYVESSLPSKPGDNAILRTPWINGRYTSCITFSYHMLGSYMGTLRLYAYEQRKKDDYGHEILLWEKHGNQGNRWFTAEMTYRPKTNTESVQFYWEAFVFFYQSDIGIDDLSVKRGACSTSDSKPSPLIEIKTTKRPITRRMTTTTTTTTTTIATTTPVPTTTIPAVTFPVSNVSCFFESGLCGWIQSTEDDFNWDVGKDGTTSHNTGPTGDHTTGKGYFLFVEASSPRVINDRARLLSPRLTTQPHCLQLWYHMYGAQMGKLQVMQITNGVETTLIETSGNKGDSWYYEEVDINTPSVKIATGASTIRGDNVLRGQWTSSSYTQIAIDGIRGSGYPGDMAIDDIVITSESCVSLKHLTKTDVNLLSTFSCNFDSDDKLCGFTNANNDEFDWTHHGGKTGSGSTGPLTDATKGDDTGFYVYTEASSPRMSKEKAELVSPKFGSGRYCTSFQYHMWGSGMGAISVFTVEHSGNTEEKRLEQWKKEGSQGKDWNYAEFEFQTSLNTDYVQLIFQGEIGPSFTSDAALDDVEITTGRCKDRSTTSQTDTASKASTAITTTQSTTTTQKETTATTTTARKPTTPKPVITSTASTTKPTTAKRTTKPNPTVSVNTSLKPRARKIAPIKQRIKIPLSNIPIGRSIMTTPKPAPTTTPQKTTAKKNTITTSKRPLPKRTKTVIVTTPQVLTTAVTKQTKRTLAKPLWEYSCNFENEILCELIQTDVDQFDWTRNSGTTPSSGTGPISDHTLGPKRNGHYLFIEGSNPRVPNDKAVLVSPILSARPKERCLVFWYHMSGNGIGSLNVYSEYSRTGAFSKINLSKLTAPRREFTEDGNQGDVWRMAEINIRSKLRSPAGIVRFSIEAVRGNGYKSDIAIDDICITSTACGKANTYCGKKIKKPSAETERIKPTTRSVPRSMVTKPPMTTRTIPKTTARNQKTSKPATKVGPVPGLVVMMPYCTFDLPFKKQSYNSDKSQGRGVIPVKRGSRSRDLGGFLQDSDAQDDLCGWEQDTKDRFDWTLHSGLTQSALTGPNGDHTTGKGRYLFIESSLPRKQNDVAILKSKTLYPSVYCVDLFYSMYGKGVGGLLVRAQQEFLNGRRVLSYLNGIRGQQGKKWGRISATYKPRPQVKSVTFRIEGVRGDDYMGDIAIDDVRVIPGNCDACVKPNQQFSTTWGKIQNFYTGCINDDVFYIRCCDKADEVILRKVSRCTINMYEPDRINWMCNSLGRS